MKRALVILVPLTLAAAATINEAEPEKALPPENWWEQLRDELTFGITAHCQPSGKPGFTEVVLTHKPDTPIEEIEAGGWPVLPEYELRVPTVSFQEGIEFLTWSEDDPPQDPPADDPPAEDPPADPPKATEPKKRSKKKAESAGA